MERNKNAKKAITKIELKTQRKGYVNKDFHFINKTIFYGEIEKDDC